MVTTVRVSAATRDRLKALGAGRSADEVINTALDALERRRFWRQYEHAARADTTDAAESAERAAWDNTLTDGLTDGLDDEFGSRAG